LRFNEHIDADGPTVFVHACKMGLEGIVSKRKTSTYRSGRSPDWIKSKNPACEAVRREAEEDWGQTERNVTEEVLSEQADLVDVFYADFIRPLGNLVVLFAQAEAAWLELVADLTGCTEKEAGKFLQEADKVKQEILPRVYTSCIEAGARQELCDSIESFFNDRERRNRLMHDEWYVSLVDQPPQAMAMTRGLPRKKGAGLVYGDPTPEDVWDIAKRFREYRQVFSHASYALRKHRGLTSESELPSDDRS
jgi:hypothetical protein